MLIDISDVVSSENKAVTREVPIGLKSFTSRLGEFPITNRAPVALTITNQENKRLLIRGDVNLTVTIPCGRCLEDVPTDIHFTIDKEFPMENSVIGGEEMEDNDYLIGLNLDIDKLIYGEILVNWPMRVLCKEDCKGICKVCGMNLNRGNCDCQRTGLDPRMAAIQDVFNKFKEV
jgi:uncharacterized protein